MNVYHKEVEFRDKLFSFESSSSWLKFKCCCGLNVCVYLSPTPKFLCWSPKHQCDGVSICGLWEVTRFKWDHEGKASMMRLVSLHEKKGTSFLSLPYEDRAGSCPELWKVNVCCFKSLHLWYFVIVRLWFGLLRPMLTMNQRLCVPHH